MVASFIFFIVISFFMDFLIPISFSFNVDGHFPAFLQWHQYTTVVLTILCSQYFTSIAFKNKSSHWLLKNLETQLSDSIIKSGDERLKNEEEEDARLNDAAQKKVGWTGPDVLSK